MPNYKSLALGGLVLCSSVAGSFAGFINNPTVPRLKTVTDGESVAPSGDGEDRYAMTSTANPGTFVVTAEFTDEETTFNTTDVPTRWNDKLIVRAYCYETNSYATLTLSTWKQGVGNTVETGGFPRNYYETSNGCSDPALKQFLAFTRSNMGIVKVDITKDALPPAAGQTYGRLYASVQLTVRPDAQNQQLHKEKLLYAFEISRNALGQPTISTVRRGYRNIGWEPSECNNPYVNCPQEVQNLTGGTNAYPHSWPPGLVRHTTGQGCNVEASDMLSHCISVNKRPGAGNGYEAWIWWYYYINTTTLPANTNRLRIFGYRIDSNTISDRWVVLQPTVNRPDSVTRQATMDACFDQVGGKIWFQISTVEGTVDDPGRAIVTAGWLPSDFAGQLDESDFYTPDRMDFSATACVPFGDEILLDEDMFYGHLSPGTIDAPWHSGSQGRVSGVYRDGALITTYRITNGSLSMPPTSIHYGLSDVPDITSFGNPFATSQYGRSGNIPQNNPHGAAISAQYYDDNNPNICTSLWENSENENARNYVTKGVLLSNDQFGITEVNLTQNNHSVKVSQVRKRLDQSGSSTSRDRELFYTWMGKNGSGNPVLAIKRSSNLAFRYGYNQSSEFYQWIEFAPGAPALGQTFGNSLFCGINHWGNGRYNHGALAGFLEWNLPAYSSGDQLFNSIYEARVTAAHDSLNNRNLLTGNELSQFGNVVLGLLQNPTDPNDPAADGSYYFFFQGQTGTISRDISDSWNFFKLRPWGYNYFRYSVPEDFSGEDGGAAIQSDAKIWSYWIDWQ